MALHRKVKRTDATDTDPTMNANRGDSKTTRARKVRGLKDMLEMPVDIISEITRHLHPQDLLSLSWSSKSLHKFFMRKSSQYMWKQSFQSLQWNLPFPEGVIEPMWATLLFTKACTGCGTCTSGRDPIWEFNARFCYKCALTKIVDARDPLGIVLPQDKKHLVAHIPLAVFTPQRSSQYSIFSHSTYLRSEMEEVIDKWDTLLQLGDEDALALFIGKCILHVQKAPMHVARCEEWLKSHAQAVMDEAAALKNKYLKDIASRLRELGWGDELDHMQSCDYAPLRGHKCLKHPQQLTDEIWEAIRDEMDECMEQAREDRIVREHIQVLRGRWGPLEATLNALSHLPVARAYNIPIGDIALMPEIREIVDVPEDVLVDEDSFVEVYAEFGGMVERWKTDGATILREMIMQLLPKLAHTKPKETKPKETKPKGKAKAKAKAPPDIDVLKLAVIRFYCKHCRNESVPLYWPGVLAHACLRCVPPPEEEDDAYTRFICDEIRRSPGVAGMFGHLDRLQVVQPSKAAKSVIRLCGKDSDTATAEEMNALNAKLKGPDGQSKTWRDAIFLDETRRFTTSWELVTP